MGLARHSCAFPKCTKITNFQYLNNDITIVLIFCKQVARHARVCPKCAEITNFWYFNNDWSYCFDFLYASRVQWKLQISCHILARRDQASSGMTFCWNIKNFNISALVLSLCFDFCIWRHSMSQSVSQSITKSFSQTVSFCSVLFVHSCFTWLIIFHGGGPFKLFLLVLFSLKIGNWKPLHCSTVKLRF